MNAITRSLQLNTIAQQVRSFWAKGYKAFMHSDYSEKEPRYSVRAECKGKNYRFSDPDYNIIISQLAYLYTNLTRKFN